MSHIVRHIEVLVTTFLIQFVDTVMGKGAYFEIPPL